MLRPSLTALLLVGLLGCFRPDVKEKADHAQQMSERPCSVQNGTCANMLPTGWDAQGGEAALLDFVTRLPVAGTKIEARRLAAVRCAGSDMENQRAKGLDVVYTVPAAMARFPRTGTMGRDFVAGVIEPKRDRGCPTERYALAGDQTAPGRTVHVLIVNTGSNPLAQLPVGMDIRIGTYRVVAISGGNGTPVTWSVVASGNWTRCGTTHTHGMVHDFISCKGAKQVAAVQTLGFVGGSRRNPAAIGPVLSLYRRGLLRAFLPDDALESSPAWARCGELGCCEMSYAAR